MFLIFFTCVQYLQNAWFLNGRASLLTFVDFNFSNSDDSDLFYTQFNIGDNLRASRLSFSVGLGDIATSVLSISFRKQG